MIWSSSNSNVPETVKQEIKRREAISTTKKKKNEDRQKDIAKIRSDIRKNAIDKRISISNECNKYFKDNKDKLKELGICSVGTLKNHCSPYNPNRARTQKNEIALRQPLSIEFCNSILN